MKITALMLAVPLALGASFASAQTTSTTTQRTVSTPLGSVETRTTSDHGMPEEGRTVEKQKSVTEHPDGSVTEQRTKTVTRPD
jgi:hypothetical protein